MISRDRIAVDAPDSGIRDLWVEVLGILHAAIGEGPRLAEFGCVKNLSPAFCRAEGWSTRMLAWYAHQTRGWFRGFDISQLAVNRSQRLTLRYPGTVIAVGNAFDVARTVECDFLHIDCTFDPQENRALINRLRNLPHFILINNTRDCAVDAMMASLERGYQVVLLQDQRVLLELVGEVMHVAARNGGSRLFEKSPAPIEASFVKQPDAGERSAVTTRPVPLPLRAELGIPLGAGDLSKCAMVLGGACCVWDDVRVLEEIIGGPWPGVIIAANDIGVHWPERLDHWVSLHPEKLFHWKQERHSRGHPEGYTTWSRTDARGVDKRIKVWGGGASGLLAIAVAHEVGCPKVVLCGVPMTRDPHFDESLVHPAGKPWTVVDAHWKAWNRVTVLARLRGYVKSMSGRTRELLGAPSREWLGLEDAPVLATLQS